jgi:hypothetical protein
MTDVEWVEFMQKLDVAYAEYLQLPFEEQLAMRMHVPMILVPFDAVYNNQVMEQFISVFQILTTKLHYSPMFVLNFVQGETEEAIVTAKKDLAGALGIQMGQILTSIVYINETQKNFTIDMSNLDLLDKSTAAANEKIKNLVADHKNQQKASQSRIPLTGGVAIGSLICSVLIVAITTYWVMRKKTVGSSQPGNDLVYLPVKGERADVQEQIELYMTKQIPIVFKEPSDN